MRALSMLMRLAADDLKRFPQMSVAPFFEDPWHLYRAAAGATPWQLLQRQVDALPRIDKEGYKVSVDVGELKPTDLVVKAFRNMVTIEGKLVEHKDGDHYVSQNLVRRFTLPDGYEADKATTMLSEDGMLTVSVPNPPGLENGPQERIIPIESVTKKLSDTSEGTTKAADQIEDK